MLDTGIGPGDRVACPGPDHPASVVTTFATLRLGAATFVPLSVTLAGAHLAKYELGREARRS